MVASDDDGVGENPMNQRKEQVGTLRSNSPPTGGGENKSITFSKQFSLSSLGLL